jgi:hypothetical protein
MKLIRSLTLLGLALAAWLAPLRAADDTFHSPLAGVTATKPTNWFFLERADRAEGLVFACTLHAEPYAHFNPSCRVSVLPKAQAEGKTAQQLAETLIVRMKQGQGDFAVTEAPKPAELAGAKGVAFRATYSMPSQGGSVKVLNRIWVIQKSGKSYRVSLSAPQAGPEASETEFKAVLESLKLD